MNSVILSVFVGILLVVCVQSQNDSGCNLNCGEKEFCYRRVTGKMAIERCLRYRRKGTLCNDGLWKCNPEQECKPRRQGSVIRTCQDRSETTRTTMTMTMPTMPTMMTTDIPKITTDIPTDIPEIPTDMQTDIPEVKTDMPTDIPTSVTDEITNQ